MKLRICVVAIVFAVSSASIVEASLQVGTKIKLDTTLKGGSGGQFGVIDPVNPAGFGFDYFVTFCVQLEEQIVNNGQYYVTGITSENSTGKALGAQAAYLYQAFRTAQASGTGPLAGFDFNVGNTHSNALQYGIWEGMGYTYAEIASAITATTATAYKNQWNSLKGNNSTGWLQDFDVWSGTGNVRIMQLGATQGGPGNRQDQLILTPVPEASTVVVWSVLSFIGTIAVYRKQVQLG